MSARKRVPSVDVQEAAEDMSFQPVDLGLFEDMEQPMPNLETRSRRECE